MISLFCSVEDEFDMSSNVKIIDHFPNDATECRSYLNMVSKTIMSQDPPNAMKFIILMHQISVH